MDPQPNVLKEAQDAMTAATLAYLEACGEYGDNPTPETEEAARLACVYAEQAAEEYAKLKGE